MALGGLGSAEGSTAFTGNNSYGDLGMPDSLQVPRGSNLTVEGWVRLNALTACNLYTKSYERVAGGPYTYIFGFSSATALGAYTGSGGTPAGTWRTATIPGGAKTGTWYHLAFSLEGTNLSFFLDGALLGTSQFSFSNALSHRVKIGGYQASADINGAASDVRVWNRALSASEIRALRFRRLAGDESGLIGYWPLNEGTGSACFDWTAGGATGTLINASWSSLDPLGLFAVADAVTGSARFTASNAVSVTAFTVPAGYDAWQITSSGHPEDLAATNWTSTVVPPTVLSFDRPAGDSNLLFYAWFTNTTTNVTLRNTLATIVYTTVRPVSVAKVTHARECLPGQPVVIVPAEIDSGSSGGIACGLEVPIASRRLRLLSGPDTNATPDEPWITVTSMGLCEAELVVENSLGFAATSSVCTITISPFSGGTVTWTGANGTHWFDTLNWDRGLVPPADADVVIPNVANDPVMPAGTYPAAGAFGSFEVQAGAVVTCRGETNSVNGGTAASPYGTGVHIRCQSAVITGTLNADTQGFAAFTGPGGYGTDPHVACHGGNGACQAWFANIGFTNKTYGSLTQPTALGSGGHSYPGGGAIRLEVAGSLTLNGTVTANGGAVGAAGGSVWLSAATFAGTGVVRARGGDRGANPSWPGGGGGRIAIDYTASTFTGIRDANGGKGCAPQYGENDGQAGTLWETGRFASVVGTPDQPVSVIVSNGCRYYFTDSTPRYWNLTLTNGAWFEVHDGNLTLGNLTITNGTFRFDDIDGGRRGYSGMTSLAVTGDVFVAGDSDLHLPAGDYDIGSLTVLTNSTVYCYGDTNAVNGGTVDKPHGAGVVLACRSALINGTVTAEWLGFGPTNGPGFFNATSLASSHGGLEGALKGPTYGSLTKPLSLGSGGKRYPGGGAVALIVAGPCVLAGTLNASAPRGAVEGGAGGSIRLSAVSLTGGGTISARGADRGANPSWPGGGGGRVALEYGSSTFTGAVNVAGGGAAQPPTYTQSNGKTGTLFVCCWQAPAGGPASGPFAIDSRYTANGMTNSGLAGVRVDRLVTAWSPRRLAWTESLRDLPAVPVIGTAAYSVGGLAPGVRYRISVDGAPFVVAESGEAGVVAFDVPFSGTARDIAVQPAGVGAVIIVK